MRCCFGGELNGSAYVCAVRSSTAHPPAALLPVLCGSLTAEDFGKALFYCRLYQTDETIINIKLPNPYAVYVLPLADHDFVDRVADALRSELADVLVLTDALNKHFCVDLLRIHGREMIFDFLNLALQFFLTWHRIFQSWQGSGVR